jgi:hypothetical protein
MIINKTLIITVTVTVSVNGTVTVMIRTVTVRDGNGKEGLGTVWSGKERYGTVRKRNGRLYLWTERSR